MNNQPEEEPTEFLEPVEGIEHNVEGVEGDHEGLVEGEEVLEEEIVHADDVIYEDGEGAIYRDVVVYEDGTEVIEEFLEVEEYDDGGFAYVVRDEDGKKQMMTDDDVFVKQEDPQGPSSSQGYSNQRTRYLAKPHGKHSRVYLDRSGYLPHHYQHHQPPPKLTDIAKVDVESYVPKQTVNRRPLTDDADFKPKHTHRSRKNPPWQDENPVRSRVTGDTAGARSSPPVLKEPLFPEDEDMIVRFKCPECSDGFSTMERHCDHMLKNHDCQTVIRDIEFFQDRDFEVFLAKKDSKEITSLRTKKSRSGATQVFVCNYMNKSRQKGPEFVEVGMATMAERPQEVCTAFVHKIHSYECIRVKYCDTHVHHDGNLGYRVPLTVKRRLFELAFKRIPIPCMQVILESESERLLPHRTRFEEKLRNFSHQEIVELLNIINSGLKKQQGIDQQRITAGKRVAIKYEYVQNREGHETVVVRRCNELTPKERFETGESTSTSTETSHGVFQEIMARADDDGIDDDNPELVDGCQGVILDSMLYDPNNGRDPRLNELTEQELLILEAYERDIGIQLSKDQKNERMRNKVKFSLEKVNALYQALDAATHGLIASEMHSKTISNLREMSSYVVEIGCNLDAEVKAQFNPSLSVEDITKDMIAGIAMQERAFQPERRRRSAGTSQHSSPHKPYRGHPPHRSHDEYAGRVYSQRKPHILPLHSRGYDHMDHEEPERTVQMLRQQHHQQQQQQQQLQQQLHHQDHHGNLQPVDEAEDQKPSSSVIPPQLREELKAIPWTKPTRRRATGDPNTAPKKRGRPMKKATPPLGEGLADHQEGKQASAQEQVVEVATVVPVPTQGSDVQETSGPLVAIESGSQKVVEVAAEAGKKEEEKQGETDGKAAEEKETTAAEETVSQKPSTTTTTTTSPEEPLVLPTTTTSSTALPVLTPSSSTSSGTSTTTTTTTTKTRTGRVVKPKKWTDE